MISMILCFFIDYFDCIAALMQHFGFELKNFKDLSISTEMLKQGAWGILTILLAFIFGLITLIWYWFFPERKALKIEKIVSENHIENFIVEASFTQFPIALTLKSRKTYIGICLGDELINSKIEHIAIIPLLSGYRDKDDLSIDITNNYQSHYIEEGIEEGKHEALTKEHFRIIVPTDEVETFSFFDLSTYIAFKKKEMAKKRKALSTPYPDTYTSHIRYHNTPNED
ncbi:hypothetical protein ACJXWG_003187 [Vibrio parahaemolyticus]|uniref:hypothetical protein n=2 Tax=Vibrio parahaemolyticus TaxID=670 RepID=UPI00111CEA38|nr:hypothetical protein [Vibrio parahaemolyticus]MBE5145592.1 hypothetical protein [Vibrio parahaemolyticus]MDF4266110.1 hypothetical protein [Vibrio parahaemolyticus]MDF4271492.1 hypothetical protein [Vibrio parahaemolyticus]MDF4296050.1 hypothetical protein [Vibrio parahaemolyticus]